jgi:hypothetical protein
VAITNYVDVGLEVATDYATANGDTPPANGAALAVAWQVPGCALPGARMWCAEFNSELNERHDDESCLCTWQANRGLLVKGKVSTEGVSAAMAVKAW